MGSLAFQTPGLIWRCYTRVRIVSVVLRGKAQKSGVEKSTNFKNAGKRACLPRI